MTLILDFFAIFCIATFSIWWLYYYKQRKLRNYYKTIPGPRGVPVFGNALDFRDKTKGVLTTMIRYQQNYGDMVKIQIGPFRRMVLASDYKFLEFVLSSTKVIEKSSNYRTMWPWLGTGLLTSGGTKWKKHRRILTPAFHFKILEQFINSFESAGDIMIEKMRKIQEISGDDVDIYPIVTLCALDIICETAMGTSVNAQNYADSDYVFSVKEMGRIIMERAISPQKSNDFLFKLTKDYQTQNDCLQILHRYTNNVIHRRRAEMLEQKHEKTDVDDCGVKKKMAFLDLLLQATIDGEQLSHDDIREEVDTFMFEGHDTTSSGISFALYSLANNPQAQEKVIEEQRDIFGDEKNPEVTYQNLQEMKYLELVIKETLRLYPSVPFYARITDQEVVFDGQVIPKGVNINIFAYGIQRSPKFWDNPNSFDPDRFERNDGRTPYAFIPFSAGPRNCIGQKFAMLEMKSTISKVLRNFELIPASPHHELKLVAETVLKSDNGMRIGLKPRL